MLTLVEFQRTVGNAIMSPLPRANNAKALIKRNDRLTALQRLDIYRRSYWSRVLDSFFEDFPGLRTVLGQRAFNRLAKAYLGELPSQSFSLRDLGSRLETWLLANPGYAGSKLPIALDMVRLEWARIEAYDAAALAPLGPEDLVELGPDSKLHLQPHIRLLKLRYPVDESNVRALKPEPVCLAVHRMEFDVYYRRLDIGEFQILEALQRGSSLGEAVASLEDSSDRVEEWFASWSRMGWFCKESLTS